MLRLDARRTTILVVVPVLAALGTACAWSALIPGVAYWQTSVAAVDESVRLMGPAAAGISAWAAVQERRVAYIRTLSPRSPAVGPMLDLLLLTVVSLLAYGIVTLVIISATLLNGGAGQACPMAIPAGAAALILHVVIGYLVGRLASSMRPVRTLPIAVAVALAAGAWAVLRPQGTWLSLLPPAPTVPIRPYSSLRPGLAAGQFLWALGLGSGATLAYIWKLTRRAALLLPLAAALGATAVCTVRLQSYGGTGVTPDAPQGYACRQWPLPVCVHPALAAALPGLEAAVTPLAVRLAGTPGAFRKVQQLPGGAPAGVRAGVALVHLPDLATGYEHRLARELVTSLTSCSGLADAGYTALVDAWLLDEHQPRAWAGPVEAAAARWSGWEEDRRQRWLRSHYARFRACVLGPQDFVTA